MVLSYVSTGAWWERRSCATLVGPNFGPSQGQSRCSKGRDGRVAWPSRVEPEYPHPSIQASLTHGGKATCLRLAQASQLWLERKLFARRHPRP